MSQYRPPRYFGGKNPISSTGIGSKIARILPAGAIYVEACAGMCGVLLARRKAATEIANDADRLVVAFWRAVRDYPDELTAYLNATPYSEVAVHEAWQKIQDGEEDPVVLGASVCVVLSLSYRSNLALPSFKATKLTRDEGASWHTFRAGLPALCARFHEVELLNRCASVVVDRFACHEGAVIYIDPPYPSTGDKGYRHGLPDGFADQLRRLKGARACVAISGYAGDWDALDWPTRILFDRRSGIGGGEGPGGRARVEALYVSQRTDYSEQPHDQGQLFS